jgi:hypothetical protein
MTDVMPRPLREHYRGAFTLNGVLWLAQPDRMSTNRGRAVKPTEAEENAQLSQKSANKAESRRGVVIRYLAFWVFGIEFIIAMSDHVSCRFSCPNFLNK